MKTGIAIMIVEETRRGTTIADFALRTRSPLLKRTKGVVLRLGRPILEPLLSLVNQFEVVIIRNLRISTTNFWWISMLLVNRVGLRAQMRQHMVAAPGRPFVPQRANVDRGNHDPLA